ncbi:MAG TPA: hypothetical protein VF553_14520 [Pyrinomonadaceae bacterium]|jgi:hypothetical protein
MHIDIPTLKNNYAILFHLYRQGLFEKETLEFKDFGKYSYLFSEKDHEKYRDGSNRPPITYAADDLYEAARFMYRNYKRDKNPNLVWQALTLSYEINDVYLRVPTEQINFFSQHAREIASTEEDQPEKIAAEIAARIDKHLETYLDYLEDPQEQVKYKKLQVLSALAGVNAIIRETKNTPTTGRRDHMSRAETAVNYATNLLAYIKLRLPGEHTSIPDRSRPGEYMPARESYGLLGLCHYERGRALLLLGGRHTEAEQSFVLSTQAYADRLSQKELFWREELLKLNREIDRVKDDESMSREKKEEELNRLEKEKAKQTEKHEDRKSVTLRRMALTTAIGSSFLAFTRSQLTRALEGLTVARAILRENSSIVLRTYVDMLYWQIQRAQHSDRPDVLAQARKYLEECYQVFCDLTPDRHYQHRCGLEIALICFYLSQNDSQNEKAYFREAFEKLDQAEKYFLDKDKSVRHPHLHAEIYILKSHLMRNCPRRNLEGARATAETACEYAINLRQYKCEALLALAAAHWSLAREHYNRWQRHRENEDFGKYELHERESRANIGLALSANTDNNARVKAVSYLRMAKLCLIEPDKGHHEAEHHFMNWLSVRDIVEHKFCHQHAAQVEEALKNYPRKLVVDFTESVLNKDIWESEVENLFFDTCLNRVAEKIRKDKSLYENKKAHKGVLAKFLQEHIAGDPYPYINKKDLMKELGRKLGISYREPGNPPGERRRGKRR